MNSNLAKALTAADKLLKGATAPLSTSELEAVMLDYAKSKKQDGETPEAAFTRLINQRDETVEKLWAACDVARNNDVHANVLAKRSLRRALKPTSRKLRP